MMQVLFYLRSHRSIFNKVPPPNPIKIAFYAFEEKKIFQVRMKWELFWISRFENYLKRMKFKILSPNKLKNRNQS